jgi:integration host factor subunit beta
MVDVIAEKNPHLYRRDVERVVDAILLEIVQVMRQGGRAELRGFGTFSVKQRQARKGRNPRDGTDVEVGAKRAPYFKAGKEMRERLNAPEDSRQRYSSAEALGLGNSGGVVLHRRMR